VINLDPVIEDDKQYSLARIARNENTPIAHWRWATIVRIFVRRFQRRKLLLSNTYGFTI